ncbi:MAG: hypothetical protein QMD94_05825, partial [Candidatus Omnitrophota bacterium]|nr:hypothetical protein [Candidatus Omnitrophota bacterium]
MKKTVVFFFLLLFLPGCAVYKFQKAQAPYVQGFIVARDGFIIPEYTLGMGNTTGDFKTAKERFNRRKITVEYYYKRMGLISSRLTEYLIDPPIIFIKFISGIFRLPFVALSDYRYEHNPEYRKKITRLEEEQDSLEKKRINVLKEKLNAYIQKDLINEAPEIQQQKKVAEEGKTAQEEVRVIEEVSVVEKEKIEGGKEQIEEGRVKIGKKLKVT